MVMIENGLIDSNSFNPRLTFLGDRVFFNFNYNNSTKTFGIYETIKFNY